MTKQELADISKAIELPETKQRFRRKLLAVKMVAMEAKRSIILPTLDICAPTIGSYVDEYNQGGLASLLRATTV